MSHISFKPQHDQMDCGAACLSMIAGAYGKRYSIDYLRDECFLTREGVSLLGITEAAQKIGFECVSAKITTEKLRENREALPCILHWNQNHFVVLQKVANKRGLRVKPAMTLRIADPAHRFVTLYEEKFKKSWLSDGEKGVALFLQPTEKFYASNPPAEKGISIRYLFSYLKEHRGRLLLMFLMLLIGSALTLIFPFLT
jgi:ATP-binding cassette subfamily B protein